MPLNPDDFVIVRKRKKYRFALFANSPLCFEFDEWKAHGLRATPEQPIVLEIGAGTGLFSVELAARHPERVYVALDVKGDRLQRGAREAEARGLSNVYFVRARADQIDQLFISQSLSEIWLTFSDPFPKARSTGRRLSHPTFLKKYKMLLRPNEGRLLIKHDDTDFFQWSLEQLVAENWRIVMLSFDVHQSDLADEYKVKTTYEVRWMTEGRIVKFVAATR